MLLLLAAIWGASYLFIKVAVDEIPPATLVLARTVLATVLLLPVALALWGRRLVALWRGGSAAAPLVVPGAVWVAVGVLVAAFTLARNLPLGAWLAP